MCEHVLRFNTNSDITAVIKMGASNRFVTRHGLMSRMRSLVGRNTLFCQARYGQVVDEIMCGACSSRCIKRNYYLGDDEHLNRLTSHIKEVLSIRDDR